MVKILALPRQLPCTQLMVKKYNNAGLRLIDFIYSLKLFSNKNRAQRITSAQLVHVRRLR
jgi:hypothetical protein